MTKRLRLCFAESYRGTVQMTKWYIQYLQQGKSQKDALAKANEPRPTTSGDRTPAKRSSSALTPPTYTPKWLILSHGELSELEESILDLVILTGWNTAVSLVVIHFRVGHLVIDCTDQNSAGWLLTVEPKLHTWKSVPLDCRMGDDIPSPHNISLYLPRSADSESDDLLEGAAFLVLGIDEMAMNNIVARGHQLFFRFAKIPVSGLKKMAERDGMRAAPVATAPASEDLPPAEMNPAVSVRQVLPIQSAAVEKMDQ
ncbi:hypothetical protein ACLKA6_016220 [Drosophila palustris]